MIQPYNHIHRLFMYYIRISLVGERIKIRMTFKFLCQNPSKLLQAHAVAKNVFFHPISCAKSTGLINYMHS